MAYYPTYPVIPPYVPAPADPCWPAPDGWQERYALEQENARLRRENEDLRRANTCLRRANDALRREADRLRRTPPLRMPLPAFW